NTVDPLEPEPQVNQHSGQRVEDGQFGLRLQLLSNLRANDLHVSHAEVGEKKALPQRGDHRRIHCAFQFVKRSQDAALGLVTITDNGLGLDRKSTRLNSSHLVISYAVFCLKKKKK